MSDLAEQPELLARKAVCPPYPPVGYVAHIWLGHRMLTLFFVYGDDGDSIALFDFTLSPFETKAKQ